MQLDVKFNEAVICHLHLSITFDCKGHNDWILWLVTFSNISPKTWLVVINLITLPEAVVFPHCKHVEATLQCIIGAPETRAMAMRKLCVLAVVMASRGDDQKPVYFPTFSSPNVVLSGPASSQTWLMR